METRKIQEVGGGTYTVSLPREWAESEGLTQGDCVNLHTHVDDILVIQPQESEIEPPARVEIRVGDESVVSLEQTLRAAYAVGAKQVLLDASDTFTTEQRRVVDRVARNLTGMSVVEEAESRITVRTLLDPGEVSVRQSVRQLTFVALSMHRDATATLTGDANSGDLADRDDQVDRLYALIDRSFGRALARLDEVDALGLTRPELFALWRTTRELERVADHAEGLGTLAAADGSMQESVADDIRDLASMARGAVEDAVSVIIGDVDIETAREALTTRDQVCEDITATKRQLDELSTETDRLRLVLYRLQRTAEHGGNIAELGLRQEMRNGTFPELMSDTEQPDDGNQASSPSAGTTK